MAVQQAIVTQGTTLYRLSDDRAWEQVNGITSFNGPNVSKNKIDVSTFASTRREYIYGLADEGDISMNAFFYPSDRVHRQIMAVDVPSHENRDWRLELSDGTAYEFSGNLTGAPISGEIDGAVAWSLTLSISGEPTWTFGSGVGTLTYTARNLVGDTNTFDTSLGVKDPYDGSYITRGRVHGIMYIDMKDTDLTETYFIDPFDSSLNISAASNLDFDSTTRRNWVWNSWGAKRNNVVKVYTEGVHYSMTLADGSALSTAKLSSILVYNKAKNGSRICLILSYNDAAGATGTALGKTTTFKFKLLPTVMEESTVVTKSIINGIDDPQTEIVGASKDIIIPFGAWQAKQTATTANGVTTYSLDYDKRYRIIDTAE